MIQEPRIHEEHGGEAAIAKAISLGRAGDVREVVDTIVYLPGPRVGVFTRRDRGYFRSAMIGHTADL